MSIDFGSFGSLGAFPIPQETKNTAYIPPHPIGGPTSLQSLSPSPSFANLEDPLAGLDMAFAVDELLDPAAFEQSGSDGYASAASGLEASASPMPMRSPQMAQYATWPSQLPSSAPMAIPVASHAGSASIFGGGSPASSLGTMSPPNRLMATPPRPRQGDSPSGAMRSPRRHPMPLPPYSPLVYGPPSGQQLDYGRRDITPRGVSSSMMRGQTHPPYPASPSGRRRATSSMSRRDDPTAATAVLPGSPQRQRTASRPMMPVVNQTLNTAIPLSEAMVALKVLDQFVKERERCERAGCTSCDLGGTIADAEHVQALAELANRVQQRIDRSSGAAGPARGQ